MDVYSLASFETLKRDVVKNKQNQFFSISMEELAKISRSQSKDDEI